MDADLIEAYHRTLYCAYLGDGRKECLRIGAKSAWLDRELISAGRHSAVFITAENPQSNLLDEDANRKRTCALEDLLIVSGYGFLKGEGIGQNSEWPPEKSFLVFGMTREDALDLARRFDQNAFLYAMPDEAVELVFA